jgi:hypothetical protein
MLTLHKGRLIFAVIAESSYIEALSRRSGQPVVGAWNCYIRLASIAQGIVKRAQYGRYVSQIEPLAELDCALARR